MIQFSICVALISWITMMCGCSNKEEEDSLAKKTDKTNALTSSAETHELKLTDTNFEAETSKGVVLVDFIHVFLPTR